MNTADAIRRRVARSLAVTEAASAPRAWDCERDGMHLFTHGNPYCLHCGILHGAR